MVLNGNKKINVWFWLIMSNIWHLFWLLITCFDFFVNFLSFSFKYYKCCFKFFSYNFIFFVDVKLNWINSVHYIHNDFVVFICCFDNWYESIDDHFLLIQVLPRVTTLINGALLPLIGVVQSWKSTMLIFDWTMEELVQMVLIQIDHVFQIFKS
jgi:hypothetical protein